MHLAFDFDYTLADSSEGTVACANHAFATMALPGCDSVRIKKTIGLSLEKTFAALTGRQEPQAAAAFKHHFLDHAQEVMLQHIRFYQQTRSTLEALKREGHYVSIVSTKLRQRIDEALSRDGMSGLVDNVIGGGCVSRNKPEPEGLLRAMELSQVPRTQTLYIGDSVSDAECALRAGVDFIGVLSGTTAAASLAQYKPKTLLAHVGEIRSIDGVFS